MSGIGCSLALAFVGVGCWVAPWMALQEGQPWAHKVRIAGVVFCAPLILRLSVGAIFG